MRSRQKVIDATLALIDASGFEAVTVAAVATGAGVSRQTVYSIFGSREELVSQAVAGLATEVIGGIQVRLAAASTPVQFAVELAVAGRAAVREHPLLARLLMAGPGNPIFDAEMMARAAPVVRQILAPMLELDPGLEQRWDDVVELTTRLGMSVVLFDSEAIHTDDDLRALLGRWLEPLL